MDNNNRITIVVDNHADDGLKSEHGLSFFIEYAGHSMLFDTGQGTALTVNAAALGIDLSGIQTLILSHGHYDHTGGLPELAAINPTMQVYYQLDATNAHYSLHPGLPVKNISMPEASKRALYHLPIKNLHQLRGPCKLFPKIWLTGEVPRWYDFEDVGGPFFTDPQGTRPDLIADDMSLWIDTPQGLVIVLGCCHAGLLNTVEYIHQLNGAEKIHGVIGGLHLLHASPERLEKTCDKLQEWAPDWIIPCHCTGDNAIAQLQSRLGDRVKPGAAGLRVAI